MAEQDSRDDKPKRRWIRGPKRFVAAFSPLTRSDIAAIRGFFAAVVKRIASVCGHREIPEGYDFQQMLVVWGISHDRVDRVKRLMFWEAAGFATLAVLMVIAITVSAAVREQALQCSMVLAVCLVGFMTRMWRFDILRRRAWVPLWRWLLGG